MNIQVLQKKLWTITGFNIDDLIIGGHNLTEELKEHISQYIHFILTD